MAVELMGQSTQTTTTEQSYQTASRLPFLINDEDLPTNNQWGKNYVILLEHMYNLFGFQVIITNQ